MKSNQHGDLAAAFALLCLYLAITPGHYQSVDGMLMFHQARSLLHDGALVFLEPFVGWGSYTTSMYGIGLSLVYLPGLFLFSGVEDFFYSPAARAPVWARYYVAPAYAAVGAPIQALATSATAFVVARLCREFGLGNRACLAGLLLYGLGSPALVYSRSDFSQPLVALCWAGALLVVMRARRSEAARDLALAAALIFWAVLTRPLEGALLLPAAALVYAGGRGRQIWLRCAIVLGGAFATGVVVSLLVNHARYGAWLHNEYANLGARFIAPWTGIAGLSISPGRGLLWAFPAVLLSFVGVGTLWRRAADRPSVFALAALPSALLVVSGGWHMWWGGLCWGPRFMLPALPLLAVLSAAGLTALPARARAPAAWLALAAGLYWAAPGVLTDLVGGWNNRLSSAGASFAISSYPPFGAWTVLTHTFALDAMDRRGVDILWFRIARETGFLSLLVPAILMAVAGFIGLRRHRLQRGEPFT